MVRLGTTGTRDRRDEMATKTNIEMIIEVQDVDVNEWSCSMPEDDRYVEGLSATICLTFGGLGCEVDFDFDQSEEGGGVSLARYEPGPVLQKILDAQVYDSGRALIKFDIVEAAWQVAEKHFAIYAE
jgi:hypothetical protein